jgi:uncharacterized membrane protein YcjF (UPF0283 family)
MAKYKNVAQYLEENNIELFENNQYLEEAIDVAGTIILNLGIFIVKMIIRSMARLKKKKKRYKDDPTRANKLAVEKEEKKLALLRKQQKLYEKALTAKKAGDITKIKQLNKQFVNNRKLIKNL